MSDFVVRWLIITQQERDMAVSEHLETLQSKHMHLDEKIQAELRSPLPDSLRVSRLKRQKLHIKDTIRQYAELK